MYQIKNEVKIELLEKKSKFITRLLIINNENEAKEKIKENNKKRKRSISQLLCIQNFNRQQERHRT